jgi:hypothetical protein
MAVARSVFLAAVAKGRWTVRLSLIGVSVLCVAAAVWSISTGSRVPTPPRATVTAVQTGWKVVVYQGVHVDVPSSWPVVDGMHTGICRPPG